MMEDLLSWEEAVACIRANPSFKQLVRDAYLDENPIEAVKRYLDSKEWMAIYEIISRYKKTGTVLDVGAGNGLASYAFAKNAYDVISLEPGDGDTLGRGAIERVMRETGVKLKIFNGTGENIPLEDESVDIIFARQVLHHAADLPAMGKELYRVLRKGGILLSTRDHVISKKADLQAFFDSHPVHRLYGGENAYLLQDYRDALAGAGFEILQCWGPWESVLNLAPLDCDGLKANLIRQVKNKIPGSSVVLNIPIVAELLFKLKKFRSRNAPGRLYSFLCNKR